MPSPNLAFSRRGPGICVCRPSGQLVQLVPGAGWPGGQQLGPRQLAGGGGRRAHAGAVRQRGDWQRHRAGRGGSHAPGRGAKGGGRAGRGAGGRRAAQPAVLLPAVGGHGARAAPKLRRPARARPCAPPGRGLCAQAQCQPALRHHRHLRLPVQVCSVDGGLGREGRWVPQEKEKR